MLLCPAKGTKVVPQLLPVLILQTGTPSVQTTHPLGALVSEIVNGGIMRVALRPYKLGPVILGPASQCRRLCVYHI